MYRTLDSLGTREPLSSGRVPGSSRLVAGRESVSVLGGTMQSWSPES